MSSSAKRLVYTQEEFDLIEDVNVVIRIFEAVTNVLSFLMCMRLNTKNVPLLIKAFINEDQHLITLLRSIAVYKDISLLDLFFKEVPITRFTILNDDNLKELDIVKVIIWDSIRDYHDVLRFMLTKLVESQVNLSEYYKSLVSDSILKELGIDSLRILLVEFSMDPNSKRPSSTKNALSCCIIHDDVDALHYLYIAGCNFFVPWGSLFRYCFKRNAYKCFLALYNLGLFTDQDFEVLNGSHCKFFVKIGDEFLMRHTIRVNRKPGLMVRGFLRSLKNDNELRRSLCHY